VDKRRKKLTAEEQLDLRERVSTLLEEHPDWDVPQVLREVRTSLHLTQRDMARVGKISEPTLRNIEARRHSPSIETVEAMLRPFGLKLAVVRASPNPQ